MKRIRKGRKQTHGEMAGDVSALPGWSRARRTIDPATARLPSQRITINLDADVIAVFKAEAFRGGPPYQVAINQALRKYLRDREHSEQENAARTVLKALDDQEVRRKLRRVL